MQAKPRVILLPGFYGTGELFTPLQKALSNQLDVAIVRYQDESDLDDYVEAIGEQLPDNDAVLVAESFSGPIALALLARHPSRFRCAILSATFAVSPFRALARLTQHLPAAFFAPTWMSERMIRYWCLGAHPDPELLMTTNAVLRTLSAARIKSRLKMLASVDVRTLLPRVTVPMLYLQATQDKLVSGRLSRQMTDCLPQIQVQRIDGPHFLLQSRPRECAFAIEKFVENPFVALQA